MSRIIKYLVEMMVGAGVQEHGWIHVDRIAAVMPPVTRVRRILSYSVVALLGCAFVLLTVGCNGPTVTFGNGSTAGTLNIEVSRTPEERSRGLMGREILPADSGMLFEFEDDVSGAFWMKDTSIPLSIAFVDSDGKITAIENLEPFDETPVKPEGEYRYAIETNRGWFSEHGVLPGSRVSIDL